jgi:hypothetical protein|tara:strand:- start:1612 stop:1929 length:318 start_codon:yes stop_codon:yes gene_type:complete
MSKIKAPAWCENAIPTANGWEHPETGELYASGGFTPSQIDEFFGLVLTEVPVQPKVEMLIEAPVHEKGLDDMSKLELESLGRQHGIELDRRKSKDSLVARVKKLF